MKVTNHRGRVHLFGVQATGRAGDVRVRVAGKGVVSHVGSALLRLLGGWVGLTGELSKALRVRGFTPGIDRGRVLADLAVAVTDGAMAIMTCGCCGTRARVRAGGLHEDGVAVVEEIDCVHLGPIERERAKTRTCVWQQIIADTGRSLL